MEAQRRGKINELWTKLNGLYGIKDGDKKTFVTHANMRGGSLHVPDNRKEPFLQLLQFYDRTYQARMSFSERTNSSVRPVFLDLDFSSTDEAHLLMQERTYCDIATKVLLPALYECFGKEKILKAGIEIVVAFPNKKRPKSRVDEHTIVKKFGAHIRCLQKLSNGCVVGGGPYMTVEQFDTLCQLIVYELSKHFPSIPKDIFSDLVDLSPFENGGMRMLRNQKTLTTCKMHTYEKDGKKFDMLDVCDYCQGRNHYVDDSYYQPKYIVAADGTLGSATRWDDDLVKMWRETSIVVPWENLDDLYQNLFDPAQKLIFASPEGYAPTAGISKTINEAWNETDQKTGMTIRKQKKRKLSGTKKRPSGGNTERLLNKDLKEVMESWIHANFPRFCPAPTSGELAIYHNDICNFQFQYLHLPSRWSSVADMLGKDEAAVRQYWKLLPKVEVQEVLRMNKDDLSSPIVVKTDGGSPFSNACANAADTARSKRGYHCSKSTAWFEITKKRGNRSIMGCQRCYANNKKEESASLKKVTCKSFRSTPKPLPDWIALGLFDMGASGVVDPFFQLYSRSDKSAVVATMRNHLRKTGQFQSMRKMR